jgi:hypothetical protein
MPDELRRLLDRLLADIGQQSAAMGAGRVSVDQWQAQMAQSLLVGHYAGYMDGRDTRTLSPAEQARVNKRVGEQLDYLNRFAAELDQRGWEDRDGARAALYAGAVKASFWSGRTRGYDLPAQPTEGSPCMVNCACSWEMDELDPEELDADFYWRLGPTEHCRVCIDRAQQWAPLRFRGGERI